MIEHLPLLLRIAGIGLILLALIHVPIGKRLKWKEQGALLSPENQTVFHVHTFFICLTLVLMGLPAFLAPEVFLEKSGQKPYWLSAFAPGGYDATFDPLANALCLLLRLDEGDQLAQLVTYTQQTVLPDNAATGLLPSFYPAIRPGQPGWDELYANHKYAFRNVPDEFHNGGVWPVWNGFFGAALAHRGETHLAKHYLKAIHALNGKDTESDDQPGFYENFRATDGQPIGTRACTWSAAGAVLLHHYLAGKKLYFGQNFTP